MTEYVHVSPSRMVSKDAINALGPLYKGYGRPRQQDYLLDLTVQERRTLNRRYNVKPLKIAYPKPNVIKKTTLVSFDTSKVVVLIYLVFSAIFIAVKGN